MDLEAALTEWAALLGQSSVLPSVEAAAAYGSDTGAASRTLLAALRIRDAAVLPEVMRIANRNRVCVYPISTGNNWGYGSALPVRDGCVILDLSALQKILDFDAEFGVVTLEPGVTQKMLADFLDARAEPYMVPVTGAGPHCSLVGNALERGYGITPHADHFGAVTDLQAVLPDGSVYRSALHEVGGAELARLFKWGIGPYCNGLFTQSGFGIVTRMSIVLARRPECVKACVFAIDDDALLERAVAAVRNLLVKLPGTLGAVNLMNQHRVLSMAAPFPYSDLGANALIPTSRIAQMAKQYRVAAWTGFASLYGTREVVAAAQKEIRRSLSGIGQRILFLAPQHAATLSGLAQWIPGDLGRRMQERTQMLSRSLELVEGRPNETALALAYWRNRATPPDGPKNPAHDGCGLLWYAPLVPMRPSSVRAYVDMVCQVTQRHAMEPLITLTSVNDRLFDSTIPLLFDKHQPQAANVARDCYAELLHTGRSHGWFPYRVGIESMALLNDLQSNSKAFTHRLRSSLDPHALLSPGRYA